MLGLKTNRLDKKIMFSMSLKAGKTLIFSLLFIKMLSRGRFRRLRYFQNHPLNLRTTLQVIFS